MSTPDRTPDMRPAGAVETPTQVQVKERPEGPAAAALLAAGVGVAALGLVTTVAAASETVNDWLRLSESVGPLSGKTIFAVVAWLVAWAVLHALLRRSRVSGAILVITAVLVLIGLIGTFPIFFEAFAPE
ncbi:MAG TPA: hypothetical protein VFZ85_10500 [Jiangellaceae bacterium]